MMGKVLKLKRLFGCPQGFEPRYADPEADERQFLSIPRVAGAYL
jgi:hypothetical protein